MKRSCDLILSLGLICLTMLVALPSELFSQTRQDEYALAAGHYSRGQWDLAHSAFRQIMDRYPNSDEAAAARFFACEALMEQDKFGEAFQGYQTFLRKHPAHEFSSRITFRLGEAAYRAERFEVAAKLFEEFIQRNPKDPLNEFALPFLGEIRLKWDEPQLAQKAFEAALKLYPSSRISNQCRLGLAKSLQRQGQEIEARRFYEYLSTQFDMEIVAESKLQLGILSFADSDFDTAEKLLIVAEKSSDNQATKANAAYWLARIQNSLENPTEALALLEQVIESNADQEIESAALYDAAVVATKVGKTDAALKWLERLRTDHKQSRFLDDAMRLEIDLWQESGDESKALALIAQFRRNHRNSPMRKAVLESEGRHHYSVGAYDEAVATFALLLDENKDASESEQASWHYLKSISYLGLKKFKKAETELKKTDGLVLVNELPPLIEIAKATAFFNQKQFDLAAPHYARYLELDNRGSEVKRAQTEMIVCHAENKDWNAAADAITRLTQNGGLDATILETTQFVAERAYKLGNREQAESLFHVLAQEGNSKETIARGLSGLAWIKMESEDAEGAYAVFDRLINECPDSKFACEAAMTRAKFLEQQRDFERAAQMYGLVIRRFDDTEMASVARIRRAYSLQKVGGSVALQEAKTLITEYLATDSPKLPGEALFQLAWVHLDLGQSAQANELFAELVNNHPDCKYVPDAAYRLIQGHVAKNELEQARSLIDNLLSRTDVPSAVTSRVLFLSGQIDAGKNRWPEVTTTMQKLLARDTEAGLITKAQYWLAESLYRQQKYGEALDNFRELGPKMEGTGNKLAPWIQLRTAQCYGYENDWETAVEIAKRGKEAYPTFSANYEFDYVLGRGFEDDGKLTDARNVYKQIVNSANGKKSETAAISQWRIGETYFHQEEYVNAINAYYKVDSLYGYAKWRSAALMQAAKCQEHLQNKLHAIKLYKQLIETFPKSQLVPDAKRRLAKLKGEPEKESTEFVGQNDFVTPSAKARR